MGVFEHIKKKVYQYLVPITLALFISIFLPSYVQIPFIAIIIMIVLYFVSLTKENKKYKYTIIIKLLSVFLQYWAILIPLLLFLFIPFYLFLILSVIIWFLTLFGINIIYFSMKEENTEKIYRYGYYSLTSAVTLFFIFTNLIFLVYKYFLNKIIVILTEAQVINVLNTLEQVPVSTITIVTTGIVVYMSLLYYLSNKKTNILEESEGGNILKYTSTIFSIYGIFNYLILIPLEIYLVISQDFLQALLILIAFLFIRLIMIPLIDSYNDILYDYKALEGIQVDSSELKELSKNIKTPENIEWLKVIKQIPIAMFAYINRRYKPSLNKVFKYISSLSYTASIALVLLIPILGFVYEFNIFTIIYLSLSVLMWFWMVSIVAEAFPQRENVELFNGETISKVYIIEDDSKGYLIALDKNQELIKIVKTSIAKIEHISSE